MASLSDFLPYVLPFVDGCSEPMAEQHIRDICIDFCAHSGVVQFSVDPIDVVQGQVDYDIDTPIGTVTHLIHEAWFQWRPLGVFKTGDIANRPELYFPQPGSAGGTPVAIKQGPDNTFKLDIAPAESIPGAIVLLVSTKPTRKAATVDDLLLSDYAYEIGQGVAARLMRIPKKEFSDPASSMACEQIYQLARATARIRAEQSFGRTTSRVRPRRFQ